jgi:hypothetical protein
VVGGVIQGVTSGDFIRYRACGCVLGDDLGQGFVLG